MSIRPDYSAGPLSIYEHLGVVKIGSGYVDFTEPARPKIAFNKAFRSMNGIIFYHVDNILGIVYDNRFYECSKSKLISSQRNIYDYDTLAPSIGVPFTVSKLNRKIFYYVMPIDCVTQINDKFTFMKINHYNVLVEGVFTQGDEMYTVKDNDNDNYISAMGVDIGDLHYTLDDIPPEWLAGPDSLLAIYLDDGPINVSLPKSATNGGLPKSAISGPPKSAISGPPKSATNVSCPYAPGHNEEYCEIVKFNIHDNTILVAICSGKIRIVDGKTAGQYTKAAARI